jgi:oxygen-dependent protoporphyrinogen oxidase
MCFTQIYLDGADAVPPSLKATHIISALPLPVLDSILRPPVPAPASTATAGTHQPLPHLRANPHSSVTVLNLVFPSRLDNKAETRTTTAPLHPPGFGYLIPRPEHGYPSTPGAETEAETETETETETEAEAEPELGLLGVVFDTASLPEQDEDAGARFTKMTAMLGGPYPYPYLRADADDTSLDAHFVAAVVHRISEHLGHMLPPPVHYVVHRNNASIPTYLVGHTARMVELDRALHARWGGRMKVIGSGVGGVSVADCVTAGRQAAREVGAQIGN